MVCNAKGSRPGRATEVSVVKQILIWCASIHCNLHTTFPVRTMPSFFFFFKSHVETCGLGSSVGIATDYGLDGPGSNSGVDEIFRPSTTALGPTQPPAQWVLVLSQGVKCGRGVLLTTHILLEPRSWKSRIILLPILWATPGL